MGNVVQPVRPRAVKDSERAGSAGAFCWRYPAACSGGGWRLRTHARTAFKPAIGFVIQDQPSTRSRVSRRGDGIGVLKSRRRTGQARPERLDPRRKIRLLTQGRLEVSEFGKKLVSERG